MGWDTGMVWRVLRRRAVEAFVAAVGVCGVISAGPAQAERFFLHLGATGLLYKESAAVFLGGAPVPGANVSIKPSWTWGVEAGYFLSPNVALAVASGIPPSIPVNGAGTIAGVGWLGSA